MFVSPGLRGSQWPWLQVKKKLLLLFIGCLPGVPSDSSPAVLNWIAVRTSSTFALAFLTTRAVER